MKTNLPFKNHPPNLRRRPAGQAWRSMLTLVAVMPVAWACSKGNTTVNVPELSACCTTADGSQSFYAKSSYGENDQKVCDDCCDLPAGAKIKIINAALAQRHPTECASTGDGATTTLPIDIGTTSAGIDTQVSSANQHLSDTGVSNGAMAATTAAATQSADSAGANGTLSGTAAKPANTTDSSTGSNPLANLASSLFGKGSAKSGGSGAGTGSGGGGLLDMFGTHDDRRPSSAGNGDGSGLTPTSAADEAAGRYAAGGGAAGGGSGNGGSGSGSGFGALGSLFGGGSGGAAAGTNGELSFKGDSDMGANASTASTSDPVDYFNRIRADENIFKKIEIRYTQKAMKWAVGDVRPTK